MTVTVPTVYPALGAAGAEQLAYLEPIRAVSLETLVKGSTYLYAAHGRRVLAARQWPTGLQGTDATFVLVFETVAKLSAGRTKLDLHFRRSGCDLRIVVAQPAGFPSLGVASDTTGSSEGSLGLTAGLSGGDDCLVQVYARSSSHPSPWQLNAIRVTERALLSAELP